MASESVCILLKLLSSSKPTYFFRRPVLLSIPLAGIISTSSHNICLPFLSLVVLDLHRVSTRCHCLYRPGISAAQHPYHPVISTAITCVLILWDGTLLHAVLCLCKPPSIMSHISAVSVPTVRRLRRRRLRLPVSLSTLSLL